MNFDNKKVAFYTLGCKVNQYESESIKNQLIKIGYEEENFENKSDIYIVNSCTVTSIADKKTRNVLRRAKKMNPESIVIVTGCYAQTNSKELLEIEEIDFVVGNSNKSGLVDFIQDIENKKSKVLTENIFEERAYEEYEFATLREMSRAYIKIQDGCNNFCSYCKIPFGRGKSRSRSLESICKEIEVLTKEGFKEFIIIGINLGAYGEDLDSDVNLETLLETVVKLEGVERVRIGSMYPDKISDRFIEIMRENSDKLMPHLHISLQSCDNTVLERMRRNYGAELIQERLLKLRENVENMEYTADVIVGFPGETDEMFNNTYKVIKNIGFSDLHVFQYSDREKTLANTFTDKIDGNVKKKRAEVLETLRKEMGKERREKYIGKDLEVLVEEIKEDGCSYGYSQNYLRVKTSEATAGVNELVKVEISNLEKELLIGNEKGKRV
ncbi:tRNA (N(6)-L-threonylcarbamoyladenosine(37)-C(2))-methylthiotransferase MtaB [Cetobacterium somerae]|uniref:tRNA (N(6)-L-threonylcarbamoyladenosine(37)-C(2))- methylthiotransferase MtaB n=1 Tax=Cetobacterium TaxID=180162 RepID=UPI001F063F85|nr:tRNA (N(6)-L-threonylcarbamoyladenosine(37)-C(2))-methylthiotransferase MtaB [Cetobacterium somerae]MCX3067983.1 tRNA (N(6)-L-threonylcarbamoyladenosine(37)-C(2))-methylthiotransferase MtaB [Cetobacterium somerae]UPO97073.1 tRNA (N(6)-L-threonylcarbamoyladenosine(37)-C(2))-methylthiotransferase MtaB [Cetobacterium somerae]